jgi:2-(1,2-epoxy-1,2-dihydrophenyl)acetyl-CoA isomerase
MLPQASPPRYAQGKDTLLVSLDRGILTIRLNRPQALNALSPQMVDELTDTLDGAGDDDDVRVIVLAAAGRAFCAGGDITLDAIPVATMTPWQYRRNVARYAAPILKITEIGPPVIAAINGVAVGGGWDLALACDIRIAARSARFRDAYVQLGVLPELGGTYFLPRLAGLGRAKMISFTGDFVSAAQAHQLGLVDEVAEDGQLDQVVGALAAKIARGPAKAIAMTKLAMNRSATLSLRDSLDYAQSLTPALLASDDFREALTAFTERREPVFQSPEPAQHPPAQNPPAQETAPPAQAPAQQTIGEA